MRRLYELCGSPTKTWKSLPEGDHNSSVMEDGYFQAIQIFMESLGSHGSLSKEEIEWIEREPKEKGEEWRAELERKWPNSSTVS